MRTIDIHNVPGAAQFPPIEVLDEPSHGGASHVYRMGGPEQPSLHIQFQCGPVAEHGVNGTTQEALLAVLIDRLESFQAGPFASSENEMALDHLHVALRWLKRRTIDRVARGVEGKSEA